MYCHTATILAVQIRTCLLLDILKVFNEFRQSITKYPLWVLEIINQELNVHIILFMILVLLFLTWPNKYFF